MSGLYKSSYTQFCKCQKNLWINAYKPEEAAASREVQLRNSELYTWAMVKVWGNLERWINR